MYYIISMLIYIVKNLKTEVKKGIKAPRNPSLVDDMRKQSR